MFLSRRRKRKNKFGRRLQFDADSALIDSKNLPGFDTDKFEGVLEKPVSLISFWGIFLVFIFLVGFFVFKTYQYQIVKGDYYAKRALANFSRSGVIFSDRGVVFDRKGQELIWNKKNEDGDFSKRAYIDKPGFSHILGFLSYPQKDKTGKFFEKEYRGKGGVERYFNDILNGKLGERKIEVNSRGKIVSDNIIEEPEAGENLYLSIDADLQAKMFLALESYIKEKGFSGGAGAIMDIDSGEIITMVSYPEYSSAIMTEAQDKEKIKEYLKDKRNPFLNKVTYGEYTPGSIVKPFVAGAALKEKLIWPGKKIKTTGRLVIPNPYFPDKPSIFWDWKNHGTINLNQAIAWSSNVYFYLLGGGFPPEKVKGLGIKKLDKYYADFGFGQKTNIQAFSEKKGLVPSPEWKKKAFRDARPWNIGNTYYTAIGQFGFQITPLQALVAVSAIANDGKVLEPVVLKGEGPKLKRKIDISREDLGAIRRAMRETVLNGTTQSLNFDFLKIASKSGTAQIKGRTRENSWVIGFFPYDKPKYAFVFLAEDGPKDTKQSVSIAASKFFKDLYESGLGEKYFK